MTGSVVPQGSTVKLVGIDYDSPQNQADDSSESMYIHFYQTNDMLVSAWRNAFAAHCNAREDLNLMNDLGEFVVGWNTGTILFPAEPFASTEQSQADHQNVSGYMYKEDGWYNWACLESATGRTFHTRSSSQAPHTLLGSNEPEHFYSTYSGIGDIDGVIVGSYAQATSGSAQSGGTEGVLSKFAIGGDTVKVTGPISGLEVAKIGLIDSFNLMNPRPPEEKDVFGNIRDVLPKYGYKRLQDIPTTLKIQTGLSTHFTLPVGGVNVFCGLISFSEQNAATVGMTNVPDEEGGSDARSHGTVTFWVEGWNEF